MKCCIYSDQSSFKVEAELESTQELGIDSIEEYLSDKILDCLFSSSILQQGKGFFPDPWEIESEIFGHARICLENDFGTKVLVKVTDDNCATIFSKSFDLSDVIESRRDRDQGIIDSGVAIITMLTNFLNEGIWQYGLRRDDGTILTDIYLWPKHVLDKKEFVWRDSNGLLEPIIWFGLKSEDPIECWTLGKSPRNFDILRVYDNAFAQNICSVERWHLFWFCSFWALDWNAIFDNNGNPHITWMFAECGMDEPSEEFNTVRCSCPIELSENDTSTEVIQKIERFFVKKQRGK